MIMNALLIGNDIHVMTPWSGETVSNPACGAGSFLLAANDYVVKHNPHLTRNWCTTEST